MTGPRKVWRQIKTSDESHVLAEQNVNDVLNHLKTEIRALRLASGNSQSSLAEQLFMTQQTVQRAEQIDQRYRVKLDTLAYLAAALDHEIVVSLRPREGVSSEH